MSDRGKGRNITKSYLWRWEALIVTDMQQIAINRKYLAHADG